MSHPSESDSPSQTPPKERYVFVISDCHLSGGRVFEGRLNPYEDFYFDNEMCELFEYFSSGKYHQHSDGSPVEVELFINGDFFDYLNVPIQGEFEVAVTEEMALFKTESIIAGHPKVMKAIKRFASQPGKTVSYLIGNHDADLFFPKVRERITREWDPEGEFPSKKVRVIADRDRIRYAEGVEIQHGNQFETMHVLNFFEPIYYPPVEAPEQMNDEKDPLQQPLLNLPWGSFYVLKIVNRLKAERSFLDKVRPVKVFVVFGLLFDTLFTLKYMFLTAYYFLRTRLGGVRGLRAPILETIRILKQERDFLLDLEFEAREHLDKYPELKTIIFGHTHKPLNKIYPDGKQYINTGTWTKMINLDWDRIGQSYALTFALVTFKQGEAHCELRTWQGEHGPHRPYLS